MNFSITKTKKYRNHLSANKYYTKLKKSLEEKLFSNAGETLTEILVSLLIISLGIILFLSAFLASGKILRQGEAQMAAYYGSRNKLEGGETESKLDEKYLLELKTSGSGSITGVSKSLAFDSYKIGQSTNYQTGQYPITLFVNNNDSQSDRVYRFEYIVK